MFLYIYIYKIKKWKKKKKTLRERAWINFKFAEQAKSPYFNKEWR